MPLCGLESFMFLPLLKGGREGVAAGMCIRMVALPGRAC